MGEWSILPGRFNQLECLNLSIQVLNWRDELAFQVADCNALVSVVE